MGGAVIPLQIASSALTVLGQVQAGKAANAAAKAQAARRETAAKQERAVAQRKARERLRQADIAQSNALARFAAAGGAADPTTRSLLAQLEGEGQLRALDAMSAGEARAQAQEFAAEMDRFDGREAKRRANLGALSGGLSFAAKYADALDGGWQGGGVRLTSGKRT